MGHGTSSRSNVLPFHLSFAGSFSIMEHQGSRREFLEMIAFVQKHKVRPVISQVWDGLDSVNAAMDTMRESSQFGKLVVSI